MKRVNIFMIIATLCALSYAQELRISIKDIPELYQQNTEMICYATSINVRLYDSKSNSTDLLRFVNNCYSNRPNRQTFNMSFPITELGTDSITVFSQGKHSDGIPSMYFYTNDVLGHIKYLSKDLPILKKLKKAKVPKLKGDNLLCREEDIVYRIEKFIKVHNDSIQKMILQEQKRKQQEYEDSIKRVKEEMRIRDSIEVAKQDSIKYFNRLKKQLEEDLTLASQHIAMQEAANSSYIIIHNVGWMKCINNAIEVALSVTNLTPYTIKYITFTGYFTNRVGDKIQSTHGEGSVWKRKLIGPIAPLPSTFEDYKYSVIYNEKPFVLRYAFYNEDYFYARNVYDFKLTSARIEFTNGKTATVSGKNLWIE